ncbi:major facilitator superfamily domain-containing protein [Mycena floridula]|nr:major facilitator superfamily domain-containing protein [Mycena floridula]
MSVSEKSRPLEEDDAVEDRKLVRKIDLHLIPILTLLYLLSFLDRTNIGNARIVGLATDLNVAPAEYNTALALYFVGYVLFEVPANIVLKRFNPRIWLPTLTLIWGIVSVGQGLVTNQAGLMGIRFLLGVTESGLFPGTILVISMYYKRRERGWRVAVFFGGAALAGAFGGILAYAIGLMNGVGGRAGWRWIFILEGILTVVVSLGAYFLVPTWPSEATFLTTSERARLFARLKEDSDAANEEKFEWTFVAQAFKDHLVWLYALLFHGFAFVLYSLSLFLPTIIAGLGFKSWQAQLMTVPPNTLAALSIWFTVWLSSRYNRRAVFIIAAAFVAILGYIILIATKTPAAQYVGVHLAAAGVYTGNALLLSWPGENVSGQTKRAIAVAMQITIGDIGAIAGVLIYRPNFAGHQFRKPHIIAIGYLLFAVVIAASLWRALSGANRKRDILVSESKDEKLVDGDSKDVDVDLQADAALRQRLGDRDVHYRYVF